MDKNTRILLGQPVGFTEANEKFRYNTLEDIDVNREVSFRAVRGVEPITFEEDGHLMTVAPTGTGKGRSVIIPNLLTYEGPVMVVDPKGENYAVTAKKRRAMGQTIVKVDPFNVIEDEYNDTFNPFDVLDFMPDTINDEVKMLAELVRGDELNLTEKFWENWAQSLLSAICLYVASMPDKDRSFAGVYDLLFADDITYNLAVILDTESKKIPTEAYQQIATFLQHGEKVRSGVLATVQQYLRLFGSPHVRQSVQTTSFSLLDIYKGAPVTLYLIIPPHKLVSHRALFRLWVGSLLTMIG